LRLSSVDTNDLNRGLSLSANDNPADGKGSLLPRQTRSLFEKSALRSYQADDDRAVEDTIEHRHGERVVAGESRVPTAEVRLEVRIIEPRS
jgi:hypothetical protein